MLTTVLHKRIVAIIDLVHQFVIFSDEICCLLNKTIKINNLIKLIRLE